jgi:hypothetical protein
MIRLHVALLVLPFALNSSIGNAQGLMGKIQKVKGNIENATKAPAQTVEKSDENEQTPFEEETPKSAPQVTTKGKILFSRGAIKRNVENPEQFVQELDLKSPSFFNVYLPAPMDQMSRQLQGLGPNDRVSASVTRKYYLNNEPIATYAAQVPTEEFKSQTIYSDVFVPASQASFKEQEFQIGVIAHVVSSLEPGTHRLKVEYVLNVNKEMPNTTGSAGKTYENTEEVIASGEVDVSITTNDRDAYCRAYGRPKYGKGVLQGEAQLEKRIKEMVNADSKVAPLYMYADDNWTLLRGALDRVTGRQVRIYYVFQNQSGRAELADCVIRQDFDGRNYQGATFAFDKGGRVFKYVCLQNYK